MHVRQTRRLPDGTPARDGSMMGFVRLAGRFGLHVLEMCGVMCISLALLGMLTAGVATVLGISDIRGQVPVLSALVVATVLAAAMLIWMQLRGMGGRPALEMAGASLAAGVFMVVGYGFGIVSEGALTQSVCGVACLGMVAVMLFRFRLYSGHMGHQAHPHANVMSG